MKSLIENIQCALQNEGIELCGWNNGGLQAVVRTSQDCVVVLEQVTKMFSEDNPYGDDVQVTTNLKESSIFILPLENEEE